MGRGATGRPRLVHPVACHAAGRRRRDPAVGRIHALFRDQVDVNDEWIAACALAQAPALPIVTGNLKHFTSMAQRFTDLTVVHPDL